MPRPQSEAVNQALELVLKGWTQYAAAKHLGLSLSTVYRAVKRATEREKEMKK